MAEVIGDNKYIIESYQMSDEMMEYLKSQEYIFGKIPKCPRCGTPLIKEFSVQQEAYRKELSIYFVCACRVTISVPDLPLCRVQTEREDDV